MDSNSDDNDDGGDKKSSFGQRQSPRERRRRRTSLVNDSEVFTNDLLLNEKTESEQLTINFGDEINPETNVAILNEKYLDQLNHSNVIIVQDNVSDRNHYYLNMMPEIGIVACPFCHKVCLYQSFKSNFNNINFPIVFLQWWIWISNSKKWKLSLL